MTNAVLRVSQDPAKVDLELVCDVCETHLCDAEHGDELATLVSVAESHRCPGPLCSGCGARGGHYPHCPTREDEIHIGGHQSNERKN